MMNVENADPMEIRWAQAKLEKLQRELRAQMREMSVTLGEFDEMWDRADRLQADFDRTREGWSEVRRKHWVPSKKHLDKPLQEATMSPQTTTHGESECEIDEIINFPRKSSQKPSTRL